MSNRTDVEHSTGYVGDRAPATLSERMREKEFKMGGHVFTNEHWADEVAALEARLAEHEGGPGGVPMTRGEQALMTELAKCKAELEALEDSPTDILNKNYEKLGMTSALVVQKKYGRRSVFGYMRRD